MNHLRQILTDDSGQGRLDRAALDIATLHFPGLEPEPFIEQLNDLASRLADRMRNFNDGREFVEQAQLFLFEEIGFHGDTETYRDPRNSCLNQVLERRTGLPIMLSLVYMEIARRLHMPVFGIGLPKHFVVQFDDGDYATYIDPFNGGKLVTTAECYRLAGARKADPSLLQRVSKRQMALRMLHNLHASYVGVSDYERAIATLDLMMLGMPDHAIWYHHRGLLHYKLNRLQASRRDLEKFLSFEGGQEEREEVRQTLEIIRQRLAQLN